MGKNPLTEMAKGAGEATKSLIKLPLEAGRDVIVGTTRFALRTLLGAVKGTVKGAGRAITGARVFPGF